MHIAYHDTQTDLFKQNQKQCGRMFWIPWKPLLSSPGQGSGVMGRGQRGGGGREGGDGETVGAKIYLHI